MRRIVSVLLSLILAVTALSACGAGNTKVDMTKVNSLTDLKGAKIAAQAGTFHVDAMNQIPEVKGSTYPEFADLLTAVKSGAIDGYVAEEPTAFAVCHKDSTLDYVPLKNNDTGFVATAADVGIAVGLVTGSELVAKINDILAEIPAETRSALMEQMVAICAGETVTELALTSEAPANPTGVFRVAMECAYEPYNWTETEKKSVGAVAITGEGKSGLYANGYDVHRQQAGYDAGDLLL